MTLVFSHLEGRHSRQIARQLAYPRVVKANNKEFYSIRGDMIDHLCTLAKRDFPALRLFAAAFEFGTLGENLPALWRTLRASVCENQVYWHGALTPALREWVEQEYRALYAPTHPAWRKAALNNARLAFEGILKTEGYI
jgi:hypothetical protein